MMFNKGETIYKFPFEIAEEFTLSVPHGSRPIRVGLDPKGRQCIWMIVNPYNAKIDRKFYVVGTGHPLPVGKTLNHIGSFNDGPYVWNIFG